MMINKLLFIGLFASLSLTSVMGQSELFLQHRRKEGKIRRINIGDEFEIKTRDTTYVCAIVGFTDSTISVPTWHRTGRDTVYTYTYSYQVFSKSNLFQLGEARDTTVVKRTVVPLYRSGSTTM